LFLGYKPVQHVIVLNTVGNCNTMVAYYNLVRPPLYIWSIIDRNIAMWRMTVYSQMKAKSLTQYGCITLKPCHSCSRYSL